MAHYLVTGGCGFIGSHLVCELLDAGHKVTVLDDLSTGKVENIPKKAKLIIGDAADSHTVEGAFEGVDGCYHLAAIASVEKSNNEWVEAHRVNITATVNVFQTASRSVTPVPVVYASSAAVYGDNPAVPLQEAERTHPLSAYGVDKLSCELHAEIADMIHHVPNMGFRFFNVYGPRQDPNSPYSGVISIFLNRILQHEDITIFGDGEQVRDFVYVHDVVQSLIKGMQQVTESHHGHDVVNVCTGRATSVNTLAESIEKVIGYHVEHHHLPPREGDIRVSVGSPTHLQERLHFCPKTSLLDGLSHTLPFFQSPHQDRNTA